MYGVQNNYDQENNKTRFCFRLQKHTFLEYTLYILEAEANLKHKKHAGLWPEANLKKGNALMYTGSVRQSMSLFLTLYHKRGYKHSICRFKQQNCCRDIVEQLLMLLGKFRLRQGILQCLPYLAFHFETFPSEQRRDLFVVVLGHINAFYIVAIFILDEEHRVMPLDPVHLQVLPLLPLLVNFQPFLEALVMH